MNSAGQAGASEGGKSGSATAGTAGKNTAGTSTAGTNAVGGETMMNGGVGGVATGGEAGVGGTPMMTPAGEVCTACGDTQCKDTMKACTDNAECAPWLSCVKACDTAACINACDRKHENVARVYRGVYDCLCTSCATECTPARACIKKTCVDDHALSLVTTAPANLAETGLFAVAPDAGGAGGAGGEGNIGGAGGAGGVGAVDLVMPLKISARVHSFAPKYPLWADGAVKDRYVYIPKCSTIDDSDMDHWKFPIGTRFWKTFTLDGVRVETRLMERFGPGEGDWVFAAYQWDTAAPGDPTAAKLADVAGVVNADGTTHDIPPNSQCINCHGKLSEHVLGFGAFQLSHAPVAGELEIAKISNLGWLSTPAPDGFAVPGTPVQQAALGYLHGNCGGCHNQSQSIPAVNPMFLRLLVGKTTYATTDTVVTTVGIIVSSGNAAIAGKARIAVGTTAQEKLDAAANSAILIRMGATARGTNLQMPPLSTFSTKVADTAGGVKDVTDWVNSLNQ
ncbi:MAG TPA: hypothetical protein VNG33_15445 [Polyangiaceae bacterium]|nr:hypothetical protein [Polyangiaceae bacterium]